MSVPVMVPESVPAGPVGVPIASVSKAVSE
jgi:hypothetical protein